MREKLQHGRLSNVKFKDLQKILKEEGYELERRTNTTHAKFVNKSNGKSVVVSGWSSGNVKMPIVQKTLKAIGLR